MKTITKRVLAIAGVLALGLTAVKAQADSALLDALVKKGVLSNQEAQDIQASEAKEYSTTAASKLTIGSYIKNITFYGDGRLRFENINQHYEYQTPYVNDRERYRIRVGADYTYSDHLKAGFELESGTASDSGNQTIGSMFTKSSINVGKIYLQYAPVDWLTLTAGKFTNPWYETTDMVYSNDLNPEGGAEVVNFTFPLDGGSSAPVSRDPKAINDPKAMAPVSASSGSSLSVGLTSVQYLYINSNESTFPSGLNNNDVQIIGNQIPITWKINKDLTFKVAPGFTFYTGGGNTNYDGGVPINYTNNGQTPVYVYGTANSSVDPVFVSPRESDDLNVVSAPGEFDFKVANVPFRPYWDFDWNVTGKQRIQNVYLDPTASVPTIGTANSVLSQNKALGDNVAWAAGLQIGQNKKKGDWSILGEFRQIGLGAVDQNINGSDYADSYANQEGLKFSGVYNFTDFLTGTVTFYDTWAYKDNLYSALGGSPSAAPGASPSSTTGTKTPSATTSALAGGTTQALVAEKSLQRIQVDIGWKF